MFCQGRESLGFGVLLVEVWWPLHGNLCASVAGDLLVSLANQTNSWCEASSIRFWQLPVSISPGVVPGDNSRLVAGAICVRAVCILWMEQSWDCSTFCGGVRLFNDHRHIYWICGRRLGPKVLCNPVLRSLCLGLCDQTFQYLWSPDGWPTPWGCSDILIIQHIWMLDGWGTQEMWLSRQSASIHVWAYVLWAFPVIWEQNFFSFFQSGNMKGSTEALFKAQHFNFAVGWHHWGAIPCCNWCWLVGTICCIICTINTILRFHLVWRLHNSIWFVFGLSPDCSAHHPVSLAGRNSAKSTDSVIFNHTFDSQVRVLQNLFHYKETTLDANFAKNVESWVLHCVATGELWRASAKQWRCAISCRASHWFQFIL